MKKYALVLAILCSTFFSSMYGQENEVKNNQIGITLFSLRFISENYTPNGYKVSLPNGVFFKHDTKNATLRYFLAFNEFNSDYSDGPPNGVDVLSEFKQYSVWTIGTGFQKNLNYNKIRIFYGFDLFSDFSIYKDHLVGGIAGFNTTYKYDHLWLGFRPVVGLQYQFAKRFSVSIESTYSLAYRIVNTDDANIKSINKFQAYLNPINTILLSYHF